MVRHHKDLVRWGHLITVADNVVDVSTYLNQLRTNRKIAAMLEALHEWEEDYYDGDLHE